MHTTCFAAPVNLRTTTRKGCAEISRVGRWSSCLLAPARDGVALTRGKFNLPDTLTARPGRAWGRSSLLDHGNRRDWSPNDRTADMLIGHFRQKLGDDPQPFRLITMLYGVGYLFTAQ